jgi:GTPase SAR1 family protein
MNVFKETYDPTGEDLFRKTDAVSGILCLMNIEKVNWPPIKTTTEPFQKYQLDVLSDADAVIMVYDVASKKSFKALTETYAQVKPGIPVAVAAAKCDTEEELWEVQPLESLQFAAESKASCWQCSSKTDYGVKEIFHAIVTEVLISRGLVEAPAKNQASFWKACKQKVSRWKSGTPT